MRLNLRNHRPGLGLAVNKAARSGGSVWTPADLTGVYAAYDFTDQSKVWQDSARTTPVTALGQVLAAVDDISGNNRHAVQATLANQFAWCGAPATYGSELITNGGFATDTDWTKGTGVTIGSGVSTWSSVTNGVVGLSQPISVTANKLYEITFTISSRTGGGLIARFSGGTTVSSVTRGSGNGTFTQYLRAVTGNTTFEFVAAGTTSLAVDNVTVKEVLTASGNNGAIVSTASGILLESGSTTLGTPVYIAASIRRTEDTANGVAGFGAASAQYYGLLQNTIGRSQANSVITGPGSVAALSANNAWPAGQTKVLEGIFQSGTQLIGTNGVDVSAANSITTQTFTAKSGLYSTVTGTGISVPTITFAIIFSTAVPTADERILVREWLAEKGGVTL